MSFQSGINNAITVASALYTQTPEFELKKQEKLRQSEIKRLRNDYKQRYNTYLAEEAAINKKYENDGSFEGQNTKEDTIKAIIERRHEMLSPILDRLEELGDVGLIHRRVLKTEKEYNDYYSAVSAAIDQKEFDDNYESWGIPDSRYPSEEAEQAQQFNMEDKIASKKISNPTIDENGNVSNPAKDQLRSKRSPTSRIARRRAGGRR